MADTDRVRRIAERLARMEAARLEEIERILLILAAADMRTVARIHQMALAVWRATK